MLANYFSLRVRFLQYLLLIMIKWHTHTHAIKITRRWFLKQSLLLYFLVLLKGQENNGSNIANLHQAGDICCRRSGYGNGDRGRRETCTRDKYSRNWKNASRRFVIPVSRHTSFFLARRQRGDEKNAEEGLQRRQA